MESAEIVRRFLNYFAQREHTVVPSASLIADDPTLLLVNAGMVPFKPFFLGQLAPPYPRATSAQKCVRTPDIDEVGKTTRHLTFFEMLGNFSFGDYFKERAIPLAWEFLTGSLGFDGDRLWISVFLDDDEAAEIWADQVGVPVHRIQRMGDDNFWEMGETGPCGPCSEIYYDRGPQWGPEGGPAGGGGEERYVELWNLVFIQYDRQSDATLQHLPKPSIDTGAGLERILTVVEDVPSIWETDLLRP